MIAKWVKVGAIVFLIFIGIVFAAIWSNYKAVLAQPEVNNDCETIQNSVVSNINVEATQAVLSATPSIDTPSIAPLDICEWEELRAPNNQPPPVNKKTVYLTFDDGPSPNVTPKILDILAEYKIVGTFFVVGSCAERFPEILLRAHNEGHVIANHTYSHNYSHIYKSIDSFWDEYKKCNTVIEEILGKPANKLFRFPGGSTNRKGEYETRINIQKSLLEAGIIFFDWNVNSADTSEITPPKNHIVNASTSRTGGKEEIILLLHDIGTKTTTAQALPEILDFYISQGYSFAPLSHISPQFLLKE